jgi:hypothetical protein
VKDDKVANASLPKLLRQGYCEAHRCPVARHWLAELLADVVHIMEAVLRMEAFEAAPRNVPQLRGPSGMRRRLDDDLCAVARREVQSKRFRNSLGAAKAQVLDVDLRSARRMDHGHITRYISRTHEMFKSLSQITLVFDESTVSKEGVSLASFYSTHAEHAVWLLPQAGGSDHEGRACRFSR